MADRGEPPLQKSCRESPEKNIPFLIYEDDDQLSVSGVKSIDKKIAICLDAREKMDESGRELEHELNFVEGEEIVKLDKGLKEWQKSRRKTMRAFLCVPAIQRMIGRSPRTVEKPDCPC